MESVSFDTLTFDHPAAAKPARVSGTLHLPMQADQPFACMVLLTSSAGVQRHREHYYAQALNDAGVAAFIVDSFTGRGVRRTVADQTLVSGAQMEGDAFAALALLRSDPRIDPDRIGVMGVSKGGGATLNAAIAVRQRWRRGFDHLFDLHVAICPGTSRPSTAIPATHGRPIYFMLAGSDDYTAGGAGGGLCRAHARGRQPADQGQGIQRRPSRLGMDTARYSTFATRKTGRAAHNFIEDDGSHFVVAAGRAMSEPDYQRLGAGQHCVTRGARAGGGTVELRGSAPPPT